MKPMSRGKIVTFIQLKIVKEGGEKGEGLVPTAI